jgi:hypothetical protein
MRASIILALCGCGTALPAMSAQVCSGKPAFVQAPVHMYFTMGFNSNAQSYHGGLALGTRAVFGTAELGMTTYNAFEGGDSWDFGASVGWQVSPTQSRFQFCPELFVGLSDGPKNINGTGADYSAHHVSVGGDAGYVMVRKQDIEIFPNASFIVANSWATLSGATNTATFEFLVLGVAFGFNNQVNLGPSIAFPFGLQGAGTSYGVQFSIKLGKSR